MTLRREAQLHPVHYFFAGLAIGIIAAFFSLLAIRGRSSSQHDEDLRHALEYVSDSLKTQRAINDSLRHQDSTRSAIAAVARDSVAVHRPALETATRDVDAAAAAIGLSLERPAPAGDTLRMGDSTWVLPRPVASYVRSSVDFIGQAKFHLARYETALHADSLAMATKDRRIQALETVNALAQRQDSLHRARETGLEQQRDAAFRRGVKTTAKWTVVGALLAKGTIELVKAIAQ